MHAARQTRIEAAYRAHDIDSLEFVRPVLLEDRGILHRVLVRTRSAVNIAGISIPGRRRIRMVICDLALLNYYVMREHAANRFVEAAANRFLRYFELRPGLGVSSVQLRKRLFHEMQSGASS